MLCVCYFLNRWSKHDQPSRFESFFRKLITLDLLAQYVLLSFQLKNEQNWTKQGNAVA
jgi:hypothetical protein